MPDLTTKIIINDKINQKLLQNFPVDPFADIKIFTETTVLQLSMAYLMLDSEYFALVPAEDKEIDLSTMKEQPLIMVIRSLYGGELSTSSSVELEDIYKVIIFLGIEQYKQNLIDFLQVNHSNNKETSLYNSIAILEFCFKYNLLIEEISEYHFSLKLKVLQSSKNYLQISKLSENTINTLLLKFHLLEGQAADLIISHILENYFNRKAFKPADYLVDQNLQQLKIIWEKFHHKLAPKTSQLLEKSEEFQRETQKINLKKYSTSSNFQALGFDITSGLYKSEKVDEESLLDYRICALEKELENKSIKIQSLKEEVVKLKERLKENRQIHENQLEDLSLLTKIKQSRKSKEDKMFIFDDMSINQPAVNEKNIIQPKQTKGKLPKISLTKKY